MSKKGWFYTGFFVALVLIFYFILTRLIPGFGKKKTNPISYVRPFSFTNQDGKQVTEKDVAGKVYVAGYFFTTCPSICPKMNNYLRLAYDRYKDENDFLILSHTCMPDTDSVPVLKKYADSMGVNSHWQFLTGRKDSLYNMARISYTIDDPNDNLANLDDDFMHTQLWALVDKNGDVRKIYDGLKKSEVEEMIMEIEKLLKEKPEE